MLVDLIYLLLKQQIGNVDKGVNLGQFETTTTQSTNVSGFDTSAFKTTGNVDTGANLGHFEITTTIQSTNVSGFDISAFKTTGNVDTFSKFRTI